MKTKPLPPIEILKNVLSYDKESGKFIRNNFKRTGKPMEAGFIYTRGDKKRQDVRIKIGDVAYLAHRLAWMLHTGVDPLDNEIDHKNGDSTDNRFCNLRLVDRTVNCRNAKKRADNKSGITGVSFDKRKLMWVTQTGTDNGRVCKAFDNLLDACCFRLSLLNKINYSKRHGV